MVIFGQIFQIMMTFSPKRFAAANIYERFLLFFKICIKTLGRVIFGKIISSMVESSRVEPGWVESGWVKEECK